MKRLHHIQLGAVFAILLAALLFAAPEVAAQAIPIDIPDTPGESPGDREREKREERHRAAFSRIFGTTSLSASPVLTGPGFFVDTVVEGAVEIGGGDALFMMLGARHATDDPWAPRLGGAHEVDGETGSLFAFGYELGLAKFSTHPLIGRSAVSMSVGGLQGDADMMFVDVSPRYIIRPNIYWSFPVGFRLTATLLGDRAEAIGSAGITFGVRRHFGQRSRLE